MAFSGQSFSVNQVLTAAQMNTMDGNIDEVRKLHIGGSAPAELVAGVPWLDNTTAGDWRLKIYDGNDQVLFGIVDNTNNRATVPSGFLGTEQSASGTAVDFTGIPSWVKKIRILLEDVSLDGTDEMVVQIGDSGGIETSGYSTRAATVTASGNTLASSGVGYLLNAVLTASEAVIGELTLSLKDGTNNTWTASGNFLSTGVVACHYTAGVKSLSGTLDRIRITTNGSDNFDGGSINIIYE